MDLINFPLGLLVGIVIGYLRWGRPFYKLIGASPVPLKTDITDADIEKELRAQRTIEAIRLYRARTGCGLKEAKQAVNVMAQNIGIHS